MKNLLTIAVLLILSSCSSQEVKDCPLEEYDNYERKAMLNYVDSNYTEAIGNFEKAFEIKNDELENDYFFAAAAALRTGDEAKAEEFIKSSIILTNADRSYFDNFREFNDYRNSKVLTTISNEYGTYQNEFRSKLKYPKVYDELEMMLERDQAVRMDNPDGEDMTEVDAANIQRLIEITKEYGWQDKSWMLLWHRRLNFREDNYVWNYFRPVIDSLMGECKIRKDYWARYEDQVAIMKEGHQVYGTWSGDYEYNPIKDVINIDRKRDSVGLAPLWYMNKVYNVDLPDGYTGKKSLQ